MTKPTAFSVAPYMDVYFCDPQRPWQCGTNENTNGLLRRFFPKDTDLFLYGPENLKYVCHLFNGHSCKTLGWKTPAERLEIYY